MSAVRRILWVSPKLPFPLVSGDRMRQFNLLRRLGARHAIDLVTFVDASDGPEAIAAMEKHCDRVVPVPLPPREPFLRRAAASLHPRTPFYCHRYASAAMRAVIAGLVRERAYDAMDVQHVYLAPYFDAAGGGPARVLTMHNVESRLAARCGAVETGLERLYWAHEARKLAALERRWLPALDAVVVMSEADRRAAAALAPRARLRVVDNGVDTDAYVVGPDDAASTAVVFTGSLAYPPNADAAGFLLDAVWPRVRSQVPDATCAIVGRDPSPALRRRDGVDGVAVTGLVDDVRPYLARAAVVAVPLRAGGGTRLKILEAMASGRAIVSTRLGAEGLEAEDGRHLVLADDPADFAAAVVALLRDPGRRRALGRAARRQAEDRYDWARCARALEAVYDAVARTPCAS
jgi:sugar transferase (PEP-CTERM/EpsH1 system associated)